MDPDSIGLIIAVALVLFLGWRASRKRGRPDERGWYLIEAHQTITGLRPAWRAPRPSSG